MAHTKKVRMKQGRQAGDGKPPLHPGDEVELDAADAKRLVDAGNAEYVGGESHASSSGKVDEEGDNPVASPKRK